MNQDFTYHFQGVPPEQTDNHAMRAWLSQDDRTCLNLRYWKLKKLYVSGVPYEILPTKETVKAYKLKLPWISSYAGDRIVGHPLCIGANQRYAILQTVTMKDSFVHFILVDTFRRTASVFEDRMKVFRQDIVTMSPIECVMPPYRNLPGNSYCVKWILRLPSAVLSPRKCSKMFFCSYTGGFSIRTYKDRRFQAVVYNCSGNKVAVSEVDEYCTTGFVTIINAENQEQLDHCKFALKPSEPELEEEYNTVPSIVRQNLLCYNYCGDRLVCTVLLVSSLGYELNIYIFNTSPRIELIEYFVKPLGQHCQISYKSPRLYGSCSLSFDPSDQNVEVWWWGKGTVRGLWLDGTPLRKEIKLAELCRRALLERVAPHHLEKLPLPSSIIDFLRFHNS